LGTQSQLTDEQKAKVSLMLADGELSAAQIGAHFGVSRQTILGLAYRERERQKKANPNAIQVNKKERDQRRAQTLKFKSHEFQPKSKPIALPKIKADEPEVLGPTNDFPPSGTCQYTRDHPNEGKPWRMCGHPGAPYCDWHLNNRIRRQEGYG
jgi:hypothetical protein